eukprot:1146759-Pelagomonas_calceolata.AAC.2
MSLHTSLTGAPSPTASILSATHPSKSYMVPPPLVPGLPSFSNALAPLSTGKSVARDPLTPTGGGRGPPTAELPRFVAHSEVARLPPKDGIEEAGMLTSGGVGVCSAAAAAGGAPGAAGAGALPWVFAAAVAGGAVAPRACAVEAGGAGASAAAVGGRGTSVTADADGGVVVAAGLLWMAAGAGPGASEAATAAAAAAAPAPGARRSCLRPAWVAVR